MTALFLCAWLSGLVSQTDPSPPPWFRDACLPIRSIQVTDDELSDLEPLIDKIGPARMVLLGEQSHGDAETFLAKCRLVRFLHERMGFDVLAWESGLYDVRAVNGALRSDMPVNAAGAFGIFGIWSMTEQVAPVLEYARSTWQTTRPLEMAGFDCQFSTGRAQKEYLPELLALVDRVDPGSLSSETRRELEEGMTRLTKYPYEANPKERELFREALERVRALLESRRDDFERHHSRRELEFQARILENVLRLEELRAQPRQGAATDNNLRDAAMGENLVWLANHRYPDRKLIVWAASSHNLYHATSMELPGVSFSYEGYQATGEFVHEAFGEAAYSIFFTAYQGQAGTPWRPVHEIAPAPENTLESWFRATGHPYAFLDLRSLPPAGRAWFDTPQLARPLGHMHTRTVWSRQCDAFFYVEKLSPTTMDDEVASRVRAVLQARAEKTGTAGRSQPAAHEAAYLGDGQIHLVDLLTTEERVLVDDLEYERPITWSPDGGTLLYWKHSEIGWDIWAVDIESGSSSNLTQVKSGGCRSPSFSPDGTRIAFMRDDPPGLYLMKRDGSESRRLTPLGHRDAPPSWSPDGQHILLEDNWTLHVIAASGGETTELIRGHDATWCPVPGPIVYVARQEEGWGICTIDPESREQIVLVSHPHRVSYPVWSPDGAWIAYFSTPGAGAGANLRVIARSGEGDRSLGTVPGKPFPPSWSPCSGFLAYASGGSPGLPLHWIDLARAQVRIVTPRPAGWPRWRPTK